MIQKTKGDCDHCDRKDVDIHKNSPLNGKYCYYCNEDRKKEKKDSSTYYPTQKSKSKSNRKPTGEAAMFKAIWKVRKKVSYLSGKRLDYIPGSSFWFNLFAHVIPKGRYPEYRLNMKNIILLTPLEHHLLDRGTEAQRDKYAKENNCDWSIVYDLRDQLLEEYKVENSLK